MWAFDSWTLDLYLDVLNAYNHRSIEPDAGAERLNYSFFATAGTLSELRSADATSTGQPRATTVDYTAPGTPDRCACGWWSATGAAASAGSSAGCRSPVPEARGR